MTGEALKIGLVGAGKGGSALLALLLEWSEGSVAVVVDPRSDAPGLETARALGIPTAAHHLAVYSHSLDIVLEVTGRREVLEELLRAKPAHVEVIGAASLRFFWTLLQSRAEAARQLRVQLDLAVAVGSPRDPKRQVAVATQKLARACAVDRAGFLLLDEAMGFVTPVTGQFATGESNERLWTAFKRFWHLPLADVPFVSEAIERRAPIEIDDPASSPLLPPGWADLFGIKSLLVLPIFREDRPVGVCLLDYCREPRRFTPEQTALGITLANQVSLAIENTHLRRRAEARAEKLTTLGTLTQAITATQSREQVFTEIGKAAVTLLGARMAHVWVADAAGASLRIEGGFGLDAAVERPLLEFSDVASNRGVIGRVFRSRTAEFLVDVQEDARWLNKALARAAGLHAHAAIPLTIGERVTGVLGILFDTRRVFSPEERELMHLLAGQAAIAIENARLFEESERRRRVAERLAETGRLLTQSLDHEEIGRRVTSSLCTLLDGHAAALFQRDPESDDLVAVAVSGTGVVQPGMILSGTARTGATRLAVRERRPVATPDIMRDGSPPADIRERIELSQFRAVLAVPVIVQDEVIGALSLRDRTGRIFGGEEIELAQSLADQAAVAMENSRLYAEATRRERQAENLARVAQVVTASLELREVLDRVAGAATDLLPDSASTIYVTDGERLVLQVECGIRGLSGLRRKTERALGEGTVGQAALTRKAVAVEDVSADPRVVNAGWIREEGFVSLISIPLLVRQDLVGVLTLFTRRRHRFRPRELASLVSFGTQAAIAIDNARLLQEAQARHGEVRRMLEELRQTQEQLTQAQKMDAVGRLAGGVAHDFNNLLTVIAGRAEVLRARLRPDDALRRDVELIRTTAERAATLTRQLLAFSRRQMLRPQVLDLNEIVASTAQMLERLIGEHIDLVISLDPQLGRVEADRSQIEQILVNLTVNARDAMPRGGRLTIETADADLDAAFVRQHVGASVGPHVMLTVRDTGIGMSKETLARVFEPFFTTKDVGKGTGLGLSTVYGIVKQSGGYVWAESDPGAGATFTIWLPRIEDVAGPSPASTTTVATAPRGSETILVVEDEDEVRALLCDVLHAQGYTVLGAANGLEALRVFESAPAAIHLVLTDLVMPGMGGEELASRLTAVRGRIAVLYMSGYADSPPALGEGRGFVQKPMTPDVLACKVRELLDQRSG